MKTKQKERLPEPLILVNKLFVNKHHPEINLLQFKDLPKNIDILGAPCEIIKLKIDEKELYIQRLLEEDNSKRIYFSITTIKNNSIDKYVYRFEKGKSEEMCFLKSNTEKEGKIEQINKENLLKLNKLILKISKKFENQLSNTTAKILEEITIEH